MIADFTDLYMMKSPHILWGLFICSSIVYGHTQLIATAYRTNFPSIVVVEALTVFGL